MKTYSFLFLLLWGGSLNPCFANNLSQEKQAIESAHETVATIRSHFRKSLESALRDKAPEKALGECKIIAPTLSKKSEKVEVGRTSLRIRNSKNAPREWIKPLLEDFSKTPREEHKPYRIVQLGPNHYGYVEPIYVEAVCLNCHGADLKPEVKAEIKQLYPEDQAIGFKKGDFRGLIWLESHFQ
jgi:hypothetical protein